jgi:hypothetical protein
MNACGNGIRVGRVNRTEADFTGCCDRRNLRTLAVIFGCRLYWPVSKCRQKEWRCLCWLTARVSLQRGTELATVPNSLPGLDLTPIHVTKINIAEAQRWLLNAIVREDGSSQNAEPTGGEVTPPAVMSEDFYVEVVEEEGLPDIERVGQPANPSDPRLVEDTASGARWITDQPE